MAILLGLVAGTVGRDALRRGGLRWGGGRVMARGHHALQLRPPTFGLVAVVSMTLVMLVVMVETTGDIIAIGEITEKRSRRATWPRACAPTACPPLLGGVFNSFPYTAFAQNVGLVRFRTSRAASWSPRRAASSSCSGCSRSWPRWSPRSRCRCSAARAWCCSAAWPPWASRRSRKVDFGDNRNLMIVAVRSPSA